jgi:acyl dehydratase
MSIDVRSLAVGDEIPVWEREGTLHHWNRFAAVNDEFADHHMDDDAGRHEGFEGAFIMAPLSHAYLHAMLRQWMGDDGRIVSIEMRLRSPLLRGRTLRAGGTVTGVRSEGEELFVDLDVWEVDDQGTRLGQGPATVAFSA